MVESAQKNSEGSPKVQFQAKLTDILYTPVNVENIANFADSALEKLIALNEAVVDAYTRDFPESDQYAGRELEDKAYQAYGLENLNDILDQIEAVRTKITQIKVVLPQHIKATNTVITPPDAPERSISGTGTGTYESPRLFNRVLTLAYILEHDFDIPLAETDYLAGSTTDSMMRQEPYVRVSVPELNRVMYVCDEESNASYVFDTEVLEQLGVFIEHLDTATKNQRNAFIRTTPTVGRRIIQSPEWRMVMKTALETPFDDVEGPQQSRNDRAVSEFQKRERGPKLDYKVFQEEVRRAHKEAGAPSDIRAWYKNEYPNHSNWSADPYYAYINKGWVSWPVLIGKEVVEFLTFDNYLSEVQKVYTEAQSPIAIQLWYRSEYKRHSGWPSNPNAVYKNKGWVSWRAMAGKEMAEFIDFKKFVSEVRKVYQEAGSPDNVQDWYKKNYKNQLGWPAAPYTIYNQNGWVSWPVLIGKEVVEFLTFEEFIKEVRTLFEEAGAPSDIRAWYKNEYPNHSNWPSSPERTYGGKGWVSYRAMVGREVVVFLSFDDFRREVKLAYAKTGSTKGIYGWYQTEYSKHPNWPSSPNLAYKNEGWLNWPSMIGKEVVEFLTFETFIKEANEAYKDAGSTGDISAWYKTEYKKHLSWPSQPSRTYKDAGWVSWPVTVGKES